MLAVGRFLRLAVSDLQVTIIYKDMPEPIDLVTMCEDIFTARQDREFVLERELYQELIELYRSPEALIEITKRKDDTATTTVSPSSSSSSSSLSVPASSS